MTEAYVGEFIDPQAATQATIDHLQRLIEFVRTKGVSEPSDLALVAKSIEALAITLPVYDVPPEDVMDWDPWYAFTLYYDDLTPNDMAEILDHVGVDVSEYEKAREDALSPSL